MSYRTTSSAVGVSEQVPRVRAIMVPARQMLSFISVITSRGYIKWYIRDNQTEELLSFCRPECYSYSSAQWGEKAIRTELGVPVTAKRAFVIGE